MSGILGIHYSNSSDEEEDKPESTLQSKESSDENIEENKVFSSGKEDNSEAENNSDKSSSEETDGEENKEESVVSKMKKEKENNVSHRHDFGETVATEWVKRIMALDEEEVRPPSRAKGNCDPKVADTYRFQIEKFKDSESSFNEQMQRRKDFRNPSIYEKLIKVCNINERGTNYPKSVYDPGYWYSQPTYQDLARMQRDHYKKIKEKNAKEAAQPAAAAKKSGSRPGSSEPLVKKSKWDAKPNDLIKQAQLNSAKYPFNVVSSSSASSSTKSIPANGNFLAKDK